MDLIDWNPPGPYRVAFTTRVGGVSESAFSSLNIGLATEDEPTRVLENRRRVAAAVGADPERASMAWQQHGPDVKRAAPHRLLDAEAVWPRCDGLWSDEPRQAMALVTADCLPIALCTIDGSPALAVLHVGWRGLLAGIVAAGSEAIGAGPKVATIGPGIGPCCYEVGAGVAGRFSAAFGEDVVADGHLDLWTSAERALRAAGCDSVDRTDLCTACEPERFFSHRRDRGRTGRQGVIGYVVER